MSTGDNTNTGGNVSSEQSQCADTKDLLTHFSATSNQLINLSAELLAILTTLSQQKNSHNLPELHQYLLKCMSHLHNNGLRSDYSPRLMEKACYALCAAFDEEIMNTSWGQAAYWENHSLVAQLFKQRNAGEVFFILLEQARQNTRRMIDFIELLYVLLRLGFKGRYMNTDGHALAQLCSDLYEDICKYRGESPLPSLPVTTSPFRPLRQASTLRFLPVILAILVTCGVLTHLWIKNANQDYSDSLRLLTVSHSAGVGPDSDSASPSQPANPTFFTGSPSDLSNRSRTVLNPAGSWL
ncbi:type IVB secretion system protein IcmH/DotU [Endozoicomonas lisbonensis]|uniref:Type IV/VI secretion system ImpK/VasF family protein n=1 Tax=Endozoicomonas lisbonensis TaxID=3120522 RepID=A0ABV2SE71_9GAMM